MITPFIAASLMSQTTQGFDSARVQLANDRLVQHIDQGHLAGAVTLVMRNGKVVTTGAYGLADIERKTPMKLDTIFQVMSMTKPVTATAVMICAEKGLLNLDDQVERHLPAFASVKVKGKNGSLVPPSPKPTIRHLLCHTSGLSSNDPGGLSDEAKALMPLRDYAALIGTEPLESQPGETIRYSGVGFTALAAIVEKVSGSLFQDFVQKEIFEPLGMKETWFFLPSSLENRLAQVYMIDGGALKPLGGDRMRTGAKFANGAGGLYSTAADMGRFIDSFRGNRLLSPASRRVMTSLQTGALPMDGGDARGFALGWSVIRTGAGQLTLRPPTSFGHTGAFGTEYWHDPATGITLVFMAQTFFIPEDARKQFTTMINAAFRG